MVCIERYLPDALIKLFTRVLIPPVNIFEAFIGESNFPTQSPNSFFTL